MIDAIVLSAGSSRRMGEPKALCRLSDSVVIDRILSTLQAVGTNRPNVVVGRPHGEAIASWLEQSAPNFAHVVWNPTPIDGMLSSIQCGLRALPPTDGVLLWPVDVPLVRPQTIRTLLGQDRRRWLVPTFSDRGGHPVWLPSELFENVLKLPSTASLRDLRDRHPPLRIAVDDPDILVDLDTPEALAAARGRLRR